ncbi:FtsK/SpoIIIE domain-containing protein [Mycolicibacterium llatzerense]|uniref:FtsK/SpoIIIE domain-containing protein n=1 Tax=Mycolicibacterium llatzerense TaxID=280871 RepID=UPI0021B5AADD|nr:FtsK/SpoIIIE domain-containing protein [Mycolicibacterium llatzerense]
MRIDMSDLVSATDLARQSSWMLKEVAAGRRFVIVKGNTPAGALVSLADLEKLNAAEADSAGVGQAWQALPAQVAFADLEPLPPSAPRHALPIGVGEDEMSTVWLDLEQYPHVYCTGSNRSGRTTFLQAVCAAIMARYTPEEAQVVVFDPDIRLSDELTDDYRTVYEYDPKRIAVAADQLAWLLDQRRPPPELTPEQLREWNPVRPKWFVVIDDMHVLTAGSSLSTILAPLVEPVQSARLLDLHVIAAITSDNWNAKGRSNKLINAMDVGGATVVVLDGSPREMIIDNVRPGPRLPGRAELYERRTGGRMIQIAAPHAVSENAILEDPDDDPPPLRMPEPISPESFLHALGIDHVASWQPRWAQSAVSSGDVVVPFGVADSGSALLNVTKLGHNALPGLIVGRTGTGKTETLRTILVALSALYSPDQVQVIVGARWPSAFTEEAQLPHITVAEDWAAFGDVVRTELERREQAGALDAEPELLVVVDEVDDPWFEQDGSVLAVLAESYRLKVHLLVAAQSLRRHLDRIWPGQRTIRSSAFRLALPSAVDNDWRALIGSTTIADPRASCGAAFLASADEGEATPLRVFYTAQSHSTADRPDTKTVGDQLIERIKAIGTPRLVR